MTTRGGWSEELHPRRPDGEFASRPGASLTETLVAAAKARPTGRSGRGPHVVGRDGSEIRKGDDIYKQGQRYKVKKVNPGEDTVTVDASGFSVDLKARHVTRADDSGGSGFAKQLSDQIGEQVAARRPPEPLRTPTPTPAVVKAATRPKVSHPVVYHTTRHPDAIVREGFKSGSGEFAGAYFGAGTYLSTDRHAADQYLEGTRMFGSPDVQQLQASAHVEHPFVVHASSTDLDPGGVMHRALLGAGLIRPGQKLKPAEVTDLLRSRGYDAVEVRQSGFNHDIGGSQLVVFDPKAITGAKRTGR